MPHIWRQESKRSFTHFSRFNSVQEEDDDKIRFNILIGVTLWISLILSKISLLRLVHLFRDKPYILSLNSKFSRVTFHHYHLACQ